MNLLFNEKIFKILKISICIGEINWSIVYDLPKEFDAVSGFNVSRFENRGNQTIFKNRLAYLNLGKVNQEEFRLIFEALLVETKNDIVALANLFVIFHSLSTNEDFNRHILLIYKAAIDTRCEKVYELLIDSLNREYYVNLNDPRLENVTSVENWLMAFHSAQYFHNNNDPVISSIRLIQDDTTLDVDYQYLIKMKPILRSIIKGWFNFNIVSDKDFLVSKITSSQCEASFISATLLNDTLPDVSPPKWLDNDIMEILFIKHWPEIGSYIFLFLYGIKYQNSNHAVHKKLKDGMRAMFPQVMNKSTHYAWQNSISFPLGLIAFYGWVRTYGHETIPNDVYDLMRIRLLDSLEKVTTETKKALADSNSDIFNSHSYGKEEYINTFPYILLLLMDCNENQVKQFKDIMFDVKPFFYGGFAATKHATNFTEFILMVLTSITQIEELDNTRIKKFQSLIKTVCDSVIIPYIHTSERHNEIWDPLATGEVFSFSITLAMFNIRLQKILNSEYKPAFNTFFEYINSVKIAKWPYERIEDLNGYYKFKNLQ